MQCEYLSLWFSPFEEFLLYNVCIGSEWFDMRYTFYFWDVNPSGVLPLTISLSFAHLLTHFHNFYLTYTRHYGLYMTSAHPVCLQRNYFFAFSLFTTTHSLYILVRPVNILLWSLSNTWFVQSSWSMDVFTSFGLHFFNIPVYRFSWMMRSWLICGLWLVFTFLVWDVILFVMFG